MQEADIFRSFVYLHLSKRKRTGKNWAESSPRLCLNNFDITSPIDSSYAVSIWSFSKNSCEDSDGFSKKFARFNLHSAPSIGSKEVFTVAPYASNAYITTDFANEG